MGFTDGHPCMFSLDMKQTPETVRKVLGIAGWTALEAEKETLIGHAVIRLAMEGRAALTDAQWKLLLEKAGSRAFDHDEDAE